MPGMTFFGVQIMFANFEYPLVSLCARRGRLDGCLISAIDNRICLLARSPGFESIPDLFDLTCRGELLLSRSPLLYRVLDKLSINTITFGASFFRRCVRACSLIFLGARL